jgi:glycosyltransferase involved in cell wall biosynthesis
LKNIEIIIVNDGSTDSSPDIIEHWASVDSRVVVMQQKNQGLSGARNTGILLARGEYIAFMDADDDAEKELLESLFVEATNSHADIVVASTREIHSDSSVSIIAPQKSYPTHFENILQPNAPIGAWAKLYRTELFTQNGIQYPYGMYYEDQVTTVKLFFYAHIVKYVDRPLYNYYVSSGSITNSLNRKKIEDVFEIAKQLHDFIEQTPFADKFGANSFFRLIKMLNIYVLSHLQMNCPNSLASVLLEEMKNSPLFTLKNFDRLKEEHIGIYFAFWCAMIQTRWPVDFTAILSLLPLQLKNFLQALHRKYEQVNFTVACVEYLSAHSIERIVVYGGGRIYQQLRPWLKKNEIEVVGIVDQNARLLDHPAESFLDLPTVMERFSTVPILVSSIAYATEIQQRINHTVQQMKTSARVITVHTIIEDLSF